MNKKNKITSIAIGGFDGMHLAHQQLFNALDENGAIVVIETSYANLSPRTAREQYTLLPIFYYPLEEIRHLEGQEFINLLKEEYPKLKKIVVGYDFHFGANAKYSTEDLNIFFDGDVEVVDEVCFEKMAIHSRIIRSFISNGNIEVANKLLNKPYKINGRHIQGQGLGEKQFVPTINLDIEDYLLPQEGIYITKTIINNIKYNSVSFIGHRVTTDGKFAVETHIITNFKQDNIIKCDIEFLKKIRDNKKFEIYEDLKNQILDDIVQTKKYFKVIPNN